MEKKIRFDVTPGLRCSTHNLTESVERNPIFVANWDGRTKTIVEQSRIKGRTGSNHGSNRIESWVEQGWCSHHKNVFFQRKDPSWRILRLWVKRRVQLFMIKKHQESLLGASDFSDSKEGWWKSLPSPSIFDIFEKSWGIFYKSSKSSRKFWLFWQDFAKESWKISRGGSRIFWRGGGGAGFEQFCRPFFRSTKLIFERSQRPYFDQVFCSAINFLKKQAKKGVLGNFWKILTKTLRFFSARSPSKLVYIGAEGAFRKFLGFVTKNGYFKTVQTRTLWVGKGSNPWEETSKSAPTQKNPRLKISKILQGNSKNLEEKKRR